MKTGDFNVDLSASLTKVKFTKVFSFENDATKYEDTKKKYFASIPKTDAMIAYHELFILPDFKESVSKGIGNANTKIIVVRDPASKPFFLSPAFFIIATILALEAPYLFLINRVTTKKEFAWKKSIRI